MNQLRALLACLVCLGAAAPVRAAGGRAGGDAFDFLFLDGGARATAMGSAYTALATDSNAMLYNPAGLGRVRSSEATFATDQYFAGTTHEYAGFAHPSGFGANMIYVGYGDLQRTTISKPDGTLGVFTAYDISAAAGYGHEFFDRLSLGVAGKFVGETIDRTQASGYAFDAGALFPIPNVPRLVLGAAVQNVGPDVRFGKGKPQHMPTNARAGAAYGFTVGDTENTVSADMMKERTQGYLFGAGVESVYNKTIALRGGFNIRNNAGLGITAGIGLNLGALSVDYAIVPYGDLGLTHTISATLRWGAKAPAEYRPVRPKPRIARDEEDTPDAHFARAEEHRKAGYFSLAREELNKGAALLSPSDQRMVFYHEELGYIAWLKKDVRTAEGEFDAALKQAMVLGLREPVVADAYTGLGMCFVKDGNAEYARQMFEKALDTHPSEKTRRFAERQLEKLKNPTPKP